MIIFVILLFMSLTFARRAKVTEGAY